MSNCRISIGGVLAVIAIAGFAATAAVAQHEGHDHSADTTQESAQALPKCPVTGEPVNLAVSTPTDEGPVFFCCKDCVPKYKAKPQQYAHQVPAQRATLSKRPKIQVSCPVSGDPVDTKVFTEVKGQKVFFCCKGCISKFEGDPGKYKSDLANSYTYQTKCPVMDEEIDPKANTELTDGRRVYYCCARCEDKLFGDPAKYIPNLKAQGYDFKPEEMKHDQPKNNDPSQDGHGHDHDGHGH